MHEIPISHMTPEHKQLMLAKCTVFKSTKMPDFPNTSSTPMKTTNLGNTVTPLPNNSNNPNSQKQKGAGAGVITPMEPSNKKPKKKESKAAMAMHAKWREAAIAAGGPNAQIVIKHPEAKKLIFDYLYDSFSPQNITQIYKVRRCQPCASVSPFFFFLFIATTAVNRDSKRSFPAPY